MLLESADTTAIDWTPLLDQYEYEPGRSHNDWGMIPHAEKWDPYTVYPPSSTIISCEFRYGEARRLPQRCRAPRMDWDRGEADYPLYLNEQNLPTPPPELDEEEAEEFLVELLSAGRGLRRRAREDGGEVRPECGNDTKQPGVESTARQANRTETQTKTRGDSLFSAAAPRKN
ncbi:hypothetical protein BD779DRAFT_258587 [Infundibulicybe gibba]|nr:hypothetical protein BD779DRAFT_258587 [Infundibulicybe gibba]